MWQFSKIIADMSYITDKPAAARAQTKCVIISAKSGRKGGRLVMMIIRMIEAVYIWVGRGLQTHTL